MYGMRGLHTPLEKEKKNTFKNSHIVFLIPKQSSKIASTKKKSRKCHRKNLINKKQASFEKIILRPS